MYLPSNAVCVIAFGWCLYLAAHVDAIESAIILKCNREESSALEKSFGVQNSTSRRNSKTKRQLYLCFIQLEPYCNVAKRTKPFGRNRRRRRRYCVHFGYIFNFNFICCFIRRLLSNWICAFVRDRATSALPLVGGAINHLCIAECTTWMLLQNMSIQFHDCDLIRFSQLEMEHQTNKAFSLSHFLCIRFISFRQSHVRSKCTQVDVSWLGIGDEKGGKGRGGWWYCAGLLNSDSFDSTLFEFLLYFHTFFVLFSS